MNKHNCPGAGVDWGSTGFRAYLFDAQANLADTIDNDDGIKSTPADQFESTLFKHIGHWLKPGSTVILSGMITSRNGWLETPYIQIPAKLDGLLSHATTYVTRETQLLFLPGLSQSYPRSDVIRGEEIQILGATQNMNRATVVMPGTHSKWANVNDGTVTAFQTIVTGELFETILNHTLIGGLAVGTVFHESVFNEAVVRGFASKTLVAELFQSRSSVLLDKLEAEHVHSYLSGLLIGNEIYEAMQILGMKHIADSHDAPIILIGSDALCERYRQAFELLNLNCRVCDSTTTSDAFAELMLSSTVG